MLSMEMTSTTKKRTAELLLRKEKIISDQSKQIDEKDKTISFLTHQIRLLKQDRYGRRSEKIDPEEFGQKPLFNEAELEACSEATKEPEEKTTHVSGHQRKKRGHRPLPEDLPRVRREYDLSSDEKTCACGCEMTCIGEEVSEQLDIIPARMRVIQHARKKYVCKACSKDKENGKTERPVPIKIAERPAQIIPKSIAAPSLLANIATAKFCDHLPLYRQESIFKRINIDLTRKTMSLWMIRVGQCATPLINLLRDYMLDYDIAYSDETTVQVLKEPGRSPSSKSYIWTFIGGPPDRRAILYRYEQTRSGSCAIDFFDGFSGAVHTDGYSGYNALFSQERVTRLGCFAHARRKFIEALPNGKMKGKSGEAVRLIGKLYHIEKNLKAENATHQTIYERRQAQSRPILDDLKRFLEDTLPKVPPKSPIAAACSYTLKQWPYLINYINDGRYEIDNNRAERAIKPFVIGRNYVHNRIMLSYLDESTIIPYVVANWLLLCLHNIEVILQASLYILLNCPVSL